VRYTNGRPVKTQGQAGSDVNRSRFINNHQLDFGRTQMSSIIEPLPAPTSTSMNRDMLVASKRTVARNVVALTLVDPSGSDLPDWSPGDHIDLEITRGVVRQYSLCGPIGEHGSWTIAILREENGRGGSRHIHDELHEGSVVRVLALRNNFALQPAERYLFIAGGIGITPIIPMVAAADASHRPWRLYYGGRSIDSMAFAHDLRTEYGPNVVLCPEDEQGMLDLDTILQAPTPGQHVYFCGPAGLISAVQQRCGDQWPEHHVHFERFSAENTVSDGDAAFEVVLLRSGNRITIPADRTILQVLNEDLGMELDTSCEQGICGTCEITVHDGVPDHRDQVLSPSERQTNSSMMICVSRCLKGPITLDL
jgi:ferredoxin-NADP reductase